jgi:hypothetical protein
MEVEGGAPGFGAPLVAFPPGIVPLTEDGEASHRVSRVSRVSRAGCAGFMRGVRRVPTACWSRAPGIHWPGATIIFPPFMIP